MSPARLPKWNRTAVDYPRDATIARLFSQQAARTPGSAAVVAADGTLSYRELEERSNRLARHLQAHGVARNMPVGIATPRSGALVVGLLAILKAGGAYVPLDPAYPRERLSWIIEDSGMRAALTTAQTRDRLPLGSGSGPTVLDVDDAAIPAGAVQPAASDACSSDLAYVIYTSGSTGRPKGVMVEHRNVVNFFTGMDRVIGCDPGVWLAVTSISFDISVLELLWTLTRGFTVVVHGDDRSPSIADEIARNHVTHLQMTPSLARMLTFDARTFAVLGSLRQVLLGGETVPASLVNRLREVFKGEIHNMYGPTETTIWSTSSRVGEVSSNVSIGGPIANTQVYILDPEMRPVVPGQTGELFIGGDGVARGYWNRPDLTAERFLTMPSVGPGRIYRTGDLARFLPDGSIEFLGRADYQIKLRGQRIEPGEIEALLEKCAGVRQAVVVAREDREGDKRLVAYVVAEATGAEAANALRAALESRLPDSMVPSNFVFLPALPLTDNGKIDRKALLALPPPDVTMGAERTGGPNAPAREFEALIASIWQEALGVAGVGVHDNFFDLWGPSLMVAEVHGKLQQALQRDIALVDLFQFSTVSALASHLAGNVSSSRVSDRALRRRLARQP